LSKPVVPWAAEEVNLNFVESWSVAHSLIQVDGGVTLSEWRSSANFDFKFATVFGLKAFPFG
jgi:hypothetical protein